MTVAIILFKLSIEKWAEESIYGGAKGGVLRRYKPSLSSLPIAVRERAVVRACRSSSSSSSSAASMVSSYDKSPSLSHHHHNSAGTIVVKSKRRRHKSARNRLYAAQTAQIRSPGQQQHQLLLSSSRNSSKKSPNSVRSLTRQRSAYVVPPPSSFTQASISELALLPAEEIKLRKSPARQDTFNGGSCYINSRHRSPHYSNKSRRLPQPAFIIYGPGMSLESQVPVGYAYPIAQPELAGGAAFIINEPPDLELGMNQICMGNNNNNVSYKHPSNFESSTTTDPTRCYTTNYAREQDIQTAGNGTDLDPYASWCEDLGDYSTEVSEEYQSQSAHGTTTAAATTAVTSRTKRARSRRWHRNQPQPQPQLAFLEPVLAISSRKPASIRRQASSSRYSVTSAGRRFSPRKTFRTSYPRRNVQPSFSTVSSHGTTREYSGTVFNLTAEDGPQGYPDHTAVKDSSVVADERISRPISTGHSSLDQ